MPSTITSTPQHPPPTLTSLPKDITSHITSFLDQTSLITFARVSRHCHQFLGDSIWEHLNLALPVNFGPRPRIRPVDESGDGLLDYTLDWRLVEEAEEPYQAALRTKVKRILMKGDERKWSKVASIRLDPRPAAALPIIAVLDLSAASLRSLHIERSDFRPHGQGIADSRDTFDFKLIHSRLFFPVLTHLRIGGGANCTGGMVQLLCSMAPNLITIRINLDRYATIDSERSPEMPFPAFVGDTQIRDMRFGWHEYHAGDEDEKDAFIDLVKRSTQLRTLSVGYDTGSQQTMENLVRAVRERNFLEILFWECSLECFSGLAGLDRSGFRSLRQLVLYTGGWWEDMLSNLPPLPQLEILYLEHMDELEDLLPISSEVDPFLTHPMPPHSSAQLRASPQLREVYRLRDQVEFGALGDPYRLVDIDKSQPSAVIRSIRHGTEELIHLRILTEYVEVADMIGSFQGNIPATSITIPYSALGGALRTKIYHQTDKARWEDYTDWNGLLVPLYVLQRAMEVDGTDAEGWTGRQVEVGEASWKVLTDWRDGVV